MVRERVAMLAQPLRLEGRITVSSASVGVSVDKAACYVAGGGSSAGLSSSFRWSFVAQHASVMESVRYFLLEMAIANAPSTQ